MSSTFTCKHGSTEMLNPRNYHTWKADVLIFLKCENAIEIVLGREAPPAANASFPMRESYQRRLGRAAGMVYSSIEPNIRAVINKLPDQEPARVWAALGEKYNTATSRSGRLAIRQRFQLTTMKADTLVQDYIPSLTNLQQELVGTPEEISDESPISHLLANLSDTFKSAFDIITIRPSDDETLDSISTHLIEYETSNALRKAQDGSNPNTAGTVTEGHALTAEGDIHDNRGRQQSGRGRGNGRGRGKGRSINRRKLYDSRPVGKRFYCLNEGHRQNQCILKQKAAALKKDTTDGASRNYAEIEDTSHDPEIHVFAAISETSSVSWIIDSGASHHLTGNKQVFQDFRSQPKPITVEVATGTKCLATGSGSIYFRLDCGLLLTVKALYVPDFGAVSLISVDALNDSGFEVIFRPGSCLIKSGSLVEQRIGERQAGSRTCTLLGTEAQANCAISTSTSKTPEDLGTWHRRFAHMNLADLRLLLPREVYTEKKAESACSVCAKAKAKQQFQRKAPAMRAEKPLELIHSDLCGAISPMSLSGCRYFILYIDDYSRLSWVFFVRTITSAGICAVFREFKTMAELKLGPHQIARFHSDNGMGEYDSAEFRSILTESGISFEPAPPYTQHRNGESERMIQTHNMKARAMMLDSRLPPNLWTRQSILHARSPTAANKGVTPYQKLYGRKPDVSHLRRFGWTAYRLLPAPQHGKFASRAEVVYMLGYVHDSTTFWRLWDADRKRVIHALNIRFDELAKTEESAESIRSDPFEIENGNADENRQVDADTPRQTDTGQYSR